MLLWWDKDDKVWFVKYPDLSGLTAHGGTIDEAITIAEEVKEDWLRYALESFTPNEPHSFRRNSVRRNSNG